MEALWLSVTASSSQTTDRLAQLDRTLLAAAKHASELAQLPKFCAPAPVYLSLSLYRHSADGTYFSAGPYSDGSAYDHAPQLDQGSFSKVVLGHQVARRSAWVQYLATWQADHASLLRLGRLLWISLGEFYVGPRKLA
jgi:hypothetical protein